MIDLYQMYRNIEQATIELSNYDISRNYIGLSQFSQCPRKLVQNYYKQRTKIVNIEIISFEIYQKSYNGYTFEKRLKDRLKYIYSEDYLDTFEIKIPNKNFPDLISGHTDGILYNKFIIEIYTVSNDKFMPVRVKDIAQKKYIQLQAYMTFSEYKNGIIICESRESGNFKIYEIFFKNSIADKLLKKAQIIFEAVGKDELPECWCGKCEN